jgi:ribosomal protein L37AE/L43A
MRGGKRSLIARSRSLERLRDLRCGFCDRELVDREQVLVWIPSSGRDMAKLACDVCQVNLAAVSERFLASFLKPDEV